MLTCFENVMLWFGTKGLVSTYIDNGEVKRIVDIK